MFCHVEDPDLAKEWLEKGFSCRLYVDEPGKIWSDCTHQMDKIILLTDGNLMLIDQDHKETLSPGKEILIKAGKCHTLIVTSCKQTYWYCGFKG